MKLIIALAIFAGIGVSTADAGRMRTCTTTCGGNSCTTFCY